MAFARYRNSKMSFLPIATHDHLKPKSFQVSESRIFENGLLGDFQLPKIPVVRTHPVQ